MNAITRLAELFARFPGIGTRQSKRFVFFLLTQDKKYLDELTELIQTLHDKVTQCVSCYRFFTRTNGDLRCSICANENRNREMLMLVEKDADLDTIERTKTFDGYYFVLGGTVPILGKNEETVRGAALSSRIKERVEREGLREMILGLSANPDGENTARYVRELLAPLVTSRKLTISVLGRGLSTGSELEYTDTDTIKNALQNRKPQ